MVALSVAKRWARGNTIGQTVRHSVSFALAIGPKLSVEAYPSPGRPLLRESHLVSIIFYGAVYKAKTKADIWREGEMPSHNLTAKVQTVGGLNMTHQADTVLMVRDIFFAKDRWTR